MQSLKLAIETDGSITAVYSDALVDGLMDSAEGLRVTRASEVEPGPEGGWIVNMRAPFYLADGSQKLGWYRYRADALAAEVKYLERLLGL